MGFFTGKNGTTFGRGLSKQRRENNTIALGPAISVALSCRVL